MLNEGETNVDVFIDGFALNLNGDYPMENIGHLLDYDYYQIANIAGEVSVDALRVSTVRGHGKIEYRYEDVRTNIYEKEGTFYADFSELDFSDLGLEAGKYYFPDAFSFLQEESVTSLGGVLAMLSFEVSSLFNAAAADSIIEDAITMEAIDKKTYELRFALTNESLSHLAATLSGQEAGDIQTSIDEYMTLLEDSYLSIQYDASTQEVGSVGIALSVTPKLEDVQIGNGNYIRLGESVLRLNGDLSWEGSADFFMPELEGYQEFVPPGQNNEKEDSSWNSQA